MKMFKNFILLLTLTLVFSLTGCSPDPNYNDKNNVPITPTYSWCTIKYNANGGKGIPPRDKFVKKGETIEVASIGDLYYYGRAFHSWNTNADGGGTEYDEGSQLIANEDITLYAQWSVLPYTITYDINKGTGTVPDQEVNIGDTVILPDGSGLSRTGYIFNGWNTSSEGTGLHYAACSSFTPEANRRFYAIWAAPAINNSDLYKTVTSDGTVKFTLLQGVSYVHESMKKYYLYRSEERDGEYIKISEFTPLSSSSQLILEEGTIDWIGDYLTYYYRVAAVLEDGTEMLSPRGVQISLFYPKTYMQRSSSSSSSGYCGLKLSQPGSSDKIWEVESSQPNTRYELKINGISGTFILSGTNIPAGNYTSYTASSKNNWGYPFSTTIKRAHITTIYILGGGYSVSEFDKSCWYSFSF